MHSQLPLFLIISSLNYDNNDIDYDDDDDDAYAADDDVADP